MISGQVFWSVTVYFMHNINFVTFADGIIIVSLVFRDETDHGLIVNEFVN